MTLYVDSSRCIENRKPHTGWAVVTSDEVVASGPLPGHLSTQVAELHTLIQACVFGANSSLTIYTDSLYAFGVVHDYSSSLERLGYITTGGGAIKNYEYVQHLVATTKLPTRLAVVKIKDHQTGVDPHVLANRKADEAAKAADRQPVPKPHAPIATVSPDEMDIRQLHAQSETTEIAKWQQVGALVAQMQYTHITNTLQQADQEYQTAEAQAVVVKSSIYGKGAAGGGVNWGWIWVVFCQVMWGVSILTFLLVLVLYKKLSPKLSTLRILYFISRAREPLIGEGCD
ncbi:UNVERIFIED_CONTAM: hypothetical protein FKN15_032607 [Acipenser sinensis]